MWFQMNSRPSIGEIQNVQIVDYNAEHDKPFVEVFMQIHQQGDAAEPLTAEFFPFGRGRWKDDNWHESLVDAPTDKSCVRILQDSVVTDDERRRYKTFAAVVGRLAYHEP